jgi:histidinol phosphatase-like PHP family hydrolase
LPLGGDTEASLSIAEMVDWLVNFAPSGTRVVIGSHSPNFPQMQTSFSPEEFLREMERTIRREAKRLPPEKKIKIFTGLEMDVLIDEKGHYELNPPPELVAKIGLDVCLASFHFMPELIKISEYDVSPEILAEALEYVLNEKTVNIVAHPFNVLRLIWKGNRERFPVLANLAKEKDIALELTPDWGVDKPLLKYLIQNGNYFSFGADFHAFAYWLKRSYPEGVVIPPKERKIIAAIVIRNRDIIDRESEYRGKIHRTLFSEEIALTGEEKEKLRKKLFGSYRREDFFQKVDELLKPFPPTVQPRIKKYLTELYHDYRDLPPISKNALRRADRYFLQTPLAPEECAVYQETVRRALALGMKKEQLINYWSDKELEGFFR